MKKEKPLSYLAKLARARGVRRINAEQRIAQNQNLPERIREAARESIRELRGAIEATMLRTRSGKPIAGRKEQLQANLEKLNKINARESFGLGRHGQSNLVTRYELNKAASGKPAAYTEAETKVFYRATQKAWDRPGVNPKQRNEAILEYYGRKNLADLVQEVITENKMALRALEIQPHGELTDEERATFGEEAQLDTLDYDVSSPTVSAAGKMTLQAALGLIVEPKRK